MKTPEISYAYAVGDLIEARDPATGQWLPAYVSRLVPYRGLSGYDIRWHPAPTASWQSAGGWTYEAAMRRRPAGKGEIP